MLTNLGSIVVLKGEMFSSMETSYDYVCYMSTTNFDHLVISVEQVKGDGARLSSFTYIWEHSSKKALIKTWII